MGKKYFKQSAMEPLIAFYLLLGRRDGEGENVCYFKRIKLQFSVSFIFHYKFSFTEHLSTKLVKFLKHFISVNCLIMHNEKNIELWMKILKKIL